MDIVILAISYSANDNREFVDYELWASRWNVEIYRLPLFLSCDSSQAYCIISYSLRILLF